MTRSAPMGALGTKPGHHLGDAGVSHSITFTKFKERFGSLMSLFSD